MSSEHGGVGCGFSIKQDKWKLNLTPARRYGEILVVGFGGREGE